MKNIISEYVEYLVEKGLTFKELFGVVEFHYAERGRNGGYYHINEEVPEDIVKKGENAVSEYATQKVNAAKGEWRKKEAAEDSIKHNHIPIQAVYQDGTQLEGRIIEATSRIIRVELDKPLKGQEHIHFGFASAIACHYVFTKDFAISESGYNGASEALCWAYEDALHKSVRKLLEKLSETSGRGE